MENNIQNRQENNLANRSPANRGQGRPPKCMQQEERDRDIVLETDRLIIEVCSYCGKSVKMNVYASKGAMYYVKCPSCGGRHAINGHKTRPLD